MPGIFKKSSLLAAALMLALSAPALAGQCDDDLTKIDKALGNADLPADQRKELLGEVARRDDVIALSALTGEGVDDLREAIATQLHSGSQTHHVRLNAGDGPRIAWLHARGDVIEQHTEGDQMLLEVKLSPENWARFERL